MPRESSAFRDGSRDPPGASAAGGARDPSVGTPRWGRENSSAAPTLGPTSSRQDGTRESRAEDFRFPDLREDGTLRNDAARVPRPPVREQGLQVERDYRSLSTTPEPSAAPDRSPATPPGSPAATASRRPGAGGLARGQRHQASG